MSDQLPLPAPRPALPAKPAPRNVVDAFLDGRNPRTLDAYERDLTDFGRFQRTHARQAVEWLIGMDHGEANELVFGYRSHMAGRGLAPATIARRLAAIRMVVKYARTTGRINWALDVPSPKVEPYRDVTGPSQDEWKALLRTAEAAAATGKPKPLRDLALVRVLRDLALRRREPLALNVGDVDLAAEPASLPIVGKGRSGAERRTLTRQSRDALARWLAVHPDPRPDAPLFVRLDNAGVEPTQLSGEAVRLIVAALGRRAGLARAVRPHGLRHSSITHALDLTDGNVRDVQRHSRHAKLETLLIYDDRRTDVAGRVAQMVADDE